MGCSGRWGRKLATWEDYRDADGGAVELGLVHVSNGGFGIGFIDVEYVRGASVCTDCIGDGVVSICVQSRPAVDGGGPYTVGSGARPCRQLDRTVQRSRAGAPR